MPDDKSISEETLQELVARAAELDDAAKQRIDLPRAKAIANEVGISTAAWDAAIAERSIDAPSGSNALGAFQDYDDGKLRRRDVLIAAGLGLLVGGMMGYINQTRGGRFDVITGACAVAATLGMVTSACRGSRRSLVLITAWWAAVPVGIMLAFGRVVTDPLWFAGFSWTATMAVSAAVNYLRRRFWLKESAA